MFNHAVSTCIAEKERFGAHAGDRHCMTMTSVGDDCTTFNRKVVHILAERDDLWEIDSDKMNENMLWSCKDCERPCLDSRVYHERPP